MKQVTPKKKHESILLSVSGLNLDTPAGRPLLRGLHLTVGYEQVALVGRNGVGKSTLIELLSQQELHGCREIICRTDTHLVPQNLVTHRTVTHRTTSASNSQSLADIFSKFELTDCQLNKEFEAIGLRPYKQIASTHGFSNGELRKMYLLAAKFRDAKLLFLDEPTQDLDETGIHWLQKWLTQRSNGLIIVSHERSVLKAFNHFLIMAESGCRYFNGSFDELEKSITLKDYHRQKKYLRNINNLIEQEKHNERVLQRRRQKKNQGRVRELDRMTPKSRLNKKRSYAQVSQAKVAKIRQDRVKSVRDLVKATRRYLSVTLPMELLLPALPENYATDIVMLDSISAASDDRELFSGINLKMQRDRLAITGPNGAGKTTLLRIILQQQSPAAGSSMISLTKVGSIAQGATDWMLEESLISQLLMTSEESSAESIGKLLAAHKFPIALAERSLRYLSPGERVRAALICLFAKKPAIEFLVLDEPAYSLDFSGIAALVAGLKAWHGGLIIVSHDKGFMQEIGIKRCLHLDGQGGHVWQQPAGFVCI